MATVEKTETADRSSGPPTLTLGGNGIRPSMRRELLLGLAVLTIYVVVTGRGGPGRAAAAIANGQAMFDVERGLQLDIEPALNAWLHRQGAAIRTIASYEYVAGYLAGTFLLIIWLYLRRPDAYRWARSSFVLLNLVTVASFLLYPVAPAAPAVPAGAAPVAVVPPLQLSWSFWAAVVLARLSAPRWLQVANVGHVALTVLVVLATANHFTLDIVAGVALAWLCVRLAGIVADAPNVRRTLGERVPAPDSFFLHVESPSTPQHVCALLILDGPGRDMPAALRAIVRANLDRLPRWRQRLSAPSRWRRRRWLDHSEPDWQWHILHRDLAGAEPAALHGVLADIAATPLPADRPLWRMVVLTGLAGRRTAVVLIVHHVIADGLGLIAQVLNLVQVVNGTARRGVQFGSRGEPGPLRRAVAIAVGLVQLASDGRPAKQLGAGSTAQRRFSTTSLGLPELRDIAHRHQARVSDVLLSAVAGGLHRVLPGAGHPRELRVAVPLAARAPDDSANGNLTSAVMLDVPLGELPETTRLSLIASRSRRLRTGTRTLASQFVKHWVGEIMPPPLYRWFVRTVYGGRFFHAIVSNMPGPNAALTMAGAPILAAHPLVPLAPMAPIAIGAIGLNGSLDLGINVDPGLLDNADDLAQAIRAVIDELLATQ